MSYSRCVRQRKKMEKLGLPTVYVITYSVGLVQFDQFIYMYNVHQLQLFLLSTWWLQKWYLRHISSYNSYHQIVRMFHLFALHSPTQHCCPPFGTKLDINSILEVSHNCNYSTTATAATLFLFVCSISVSTATIKYKPIILSRKWLTKKCEEKWYNKSHSK